MLTLLRQNDNKSQHALQEVTLCVCASAGVPVESLNFVSFLGPDVLFFFILWACVCECMWLCVLEVKYLFLYL